MLLPLPKNLMQLLSKSAPVPTRCVTQKVSIINIYTDVKYSKIIYLNVSLLNVISINYDNNAKTQVGTRLLLSVWTNLVRAS